MTESRSMPRPPRRLAAQRGADPRRRQTAARALAGGDALRHRRRRGRLALDPLPPLPRSRRAARAARRAPRGRRGPAPPRARCRPVASVARRPLALDAIHVFDAVPPALLPGQLVAEAERIAAVPVALYLLDIDGSHLLHIAGDARLGELARRPVRGRAGARRRRHRPGPRADRTAGRGRGLRALAARPGDRRLPRLRPAARAAHRARPPGRRRGHPRRPLHRRLRRACSGASSRAPPPRSSRACCRRGSCG